MSTLIKADVRSRRLATEVAQTEPEHGPLRGIRQPKPGKDVFKRKTYERRDILVSTAVDSYILAATNAVKMPVPPFSEDLPPTARLVADGNDLRAAPRYPTGKQAKGDAL